MYLIFQHISLLRVLGWKKLEILITAAMQEF